MLNTASVMTTGLAQSDAPGKMPRHQRNMPNAPILSTTLTINTEVPGVEEAAASGSQVCSGHSGALIAKAAMNPRNSNRSVVVLMGMFCRSLSRNDACPARELTT